MKRLKKPIIRKKIQSNGWPGKTVQKKAWKTLWKLYRKETWVVYEIRWCDACQSKDPRRNGKRSTTKKKKQQNKERRGFRWMIPSRRLEHIFSDGYVLKSFSNRARFCWNAIIGCADAISRKTDMVFLENLSLRTAVRCNIEVGANIVRPFLLVVSGAIP